ncbi:MAG TPA: hypothetical protein VK474_05905 [Chthoniobacterales bacterium]|nr:hypothetical protein [Chthoniobacterales bacterium]
MNMLFFNRSFAWIPAMVTAGTLLFVSSSVTVAAPTDEITRAVIAGGATSVETATPTEFVKAFRSVLIRVEEKNRCAYVSAGIKLRPDLAPQITSATLRAHRRPLNDTDDCNWVDPLIRCAIAAAPNAKAEIVQAALEAEPYARECILAAAGLHDGDATAFLRRPGVDAGNINSSSLGTINPGNISGQGNVQSGNQERVTICHNGNTLTLPRPAADAHLRNHPTDTVGPCP